MTYIFKNKKIKRFINLIDSLEETLFNSKLWIYTPTGLGEIGQGNLFSIQNSINGYKEINFPRLIKSIVTFFSVITIFPFKYLLYQFKFRFNKFKSINNFKINKNLNILVAPVDLKNNLKGSHEKLFINLKKKHDDLILLPIKPLILKNVFAFDETDKKTINLSDIFFEKPAIFFSWINEVFYIFKTLVKTNKEKLFGIKKVFIILSFIESSLRQSYEIYALINFLVYKLNTSNINFYSTFEANTFEKVLVKLRSNCSYYKAFNVCAITNIHTKHNFYYRLIKEKGFPDLIYTPESELYNSSIYNYYSSISPKIKKVKNFDKSIIRKFDNFKFKFALLCEGGECSDYLLDFVKKIISYKVCKNYEIIVSLHPSVAMTNYSLKIIKRLGLETTTNLNTSISNSQIGIYLSSSSSINAFDSNLPLIKVITNNIFDCDNPLDFIKESKHNLLKLDIELKNEDLKSLKNFILNKRIQYRKDPIGWFYG